MDNLAPIDTDLAVPTRKFVTDLIVNEVAIGPTAPTDGTELWLDTSSGGSGLDAYYVKKTGDTMNGVLRVDTSATATDSFIRVKGLSSKYANVEFEGSARRWAIGKDTAAESTGDTGSNFGIWAYHDDGSSSSRLLTIGRASGIMSTGGAVLLGGMIDDPSAAVNKQYVDGGAWLTCTNGSGFTGTIYARLIGGYCQLAGILSGTFSGNPTILTLPASCKPIFPPSTSYYSYLLPAASGGTGYVIVRVWASLAITLNYAASAPANIAFDGARWPIT